MKKWLYIIFATTLISIAEIAYGQDMISYYTIMLRGGYGSMNYGLKEGNSIGNVSYGAMVEYTCFFHEYVGLGIGANFQRIGSIATLNNSFSWLDVVDTDGERYNHVVNLYEWKERQRAFYVEVPLTLQTQFDLSRECKLLVKAGAAYSMRLKNYISATGKIEHLGYYPQWNLWLDIPAYGFYVENDFNPKSAYGFTQSGTILLSADVAIPLHQGIEFLCGLYGSVNITNLNTKNNAIGFRNDRPDGVYFHPFMNDYTSVLNTDLLGNKMYSYTIQLQVGIRFNQRSRKNNCHCLNN